MKKTKNILKKKDEEVEWVIFVQIFNRQIFTVQKVPDLCFTYHIHTVRSHLERTKLNGYISTPKQRTSFVLVSF